MSSFVSAAIFVSMYLCVYIFVYAVSVYLVCGRTGRKEAETLSKASWTTLQGFILVSDQQMCLNCRCILKSRRSDILKNISKKYMLTSATHTQGRNGPRCRRGLGLFEISVYDMQIYLIKR